jgi:hypothetical protein
MTLSVRFEAVTNCPDTLPLMSRNEEDAPGSAEPLPTTTMIDVAGT